MKIILQMRYHRFCCKFDVLSLALMACYKFHPKRLGIAELIPYKSPNKGIAEEFYPSTSTGWLPRLTVQSKALNYVFFLSLILEMLRNCYRYGPSILQEARPQLSSSDPCSALLPPTAATPCLCCWCLAKSLLQVFFGQPLFLFPWGFQDRAWYVMLVAGFRRVWPSHPHLLLSSSSSMDSWFVISIKCSERIAIIFLFFFRDGWKEK